MAALEVVKDEKLAENAERLGILFRDRMNRLIEKCDLVTPRARQGPAQRYPHQRYGGQQDGLEHLPCHGQKWADR